MTSSSPASSSLIWNIQDLESVSFLVNFDSRVECSNDYYFADYRLYETQGFLGLQMAVDMAFIETIHGFNLTQKIEMQAYQYPPYKHQDKTHYTMVLSRILPAALVIGFSYMVTSSITEIVKERESGVRVRWVAQDKILYQFHYRGHKLVPCFRNF